MWEIWAIYLWPKALKSCPKSNKSPNVVTLVTSAHFICRLLLYWRHCLGSLAIWLCWSTLILFLKKVGRDPSPYSLFSLFDYKWKKYRCVLGIRNLDRRMAGADHLAMATPDLSFSFSLPLLKEGDSLLFYLFVCLYVCCSHLLYLFVCLYVCCSHLFQSLQLFLSFSRFASKFQPRKSI